MPNALPNNLANLDLATVPGSADLEANDLLLVHPGRGAAFCRRIADDGNITKAHTPLIRQRQRHLFQGLGIPGTGNQPYRLLSIRKLGRAATAFDLGCTDLLRHLCNR